jgi:hypothetical protein
MSPGADVRLQRALILPVATVHSAEIRTSTSHTRNLNFSHSRSGSASSYDIELRSPNLLHPPVFEPEQQETRCDVCGMTLNEPYICPVESCDDPAKTYTTWKRLHRHLEHSHPSRPERMCLSYCFFCDQRIESTIKEQVRHIGRHMEGIAFTIVPRAYEDLNFYSDSEPTSPRPFLPDNRRSSSAVQGRASPGVDDIADLCSVRPTSIGTSGLESRGSRPFHLDERYMLSNMLLWTLLSSLS